jgi:uncharacterized protein (DUF1015 family)
MEIKPFKAFRFDANVVGEVGDCISPPYDVVSPSQQEELYKKNQYNIVRIIKGKTIPSDNDNHNQYTRAAEYLKAWTEKGVLKQDESENIYAYVQDFEVAGTHFQRSGFIALARLEEFGPPGRVRPHERTLDEPKIDRLHLKRATVAKFGLVFMLYEDPRKIADKIIEKAAEQQPLIDFSDEQKVRHRLFAIAERADIEEIAKMIRGRDCIIADGHHRYETALNYFKETGNPAAGYQMMAFVNTCQDGLLILATHRLVGNLKNFDFEKLVTDLSGDFEVSEYPFDSADAKARAKKKMFEQMKAEFDEDRTAFGIYTGGNAFHLTVLKDRALVDSVSSDKSDAWKSLDVSVLHTLILEKLLAIDDKSLASGAHLEYVKDSGGAVDKSIDEVDSGRKQVAFFMNPAKMKQLQMVTAAGEKMPQKSTYFYPKMYTGLTINKL